MQFSATQPFQGDLSRALSLAESALTAIGFRIDQRTENLLELTGPGMNSSRESPLVGASRIQVRGEGKELAVTAELGGVERMTRFVTLFPPTLVLGLGIVFSLVFGFGFGPGLWIVPVVAAVGINALVWLILGPLIARSIRLRTCRGLEALLKNMVAVGESPT